MAENRGNLTSYRPDIKVMDCTLRDGGLVNNFEFTDEFVKDLYEANVAAGVDYMEFGYKADKDIFDEKEFGKWKFRKEEDIRKGIGDIMGGKVLELESERLKAEGRTEGEAIGQVQGETRLGSLITRLLQDQRTEEIPIVSTDAKRREQLYKEYNL